MSKVTTSTSSGRSVKRGLALAVMIIAVVATPAAASTTSASYDLAGTGSSTPGGCLDCQGPTMDASGTATCSICVAGKPATGSFTISLAVQTFPPSPCKVKTVSGTLDVSWADGTSSTASVAGKFRDSKAMSLSGMFSSTDPNYPGLPASIPLNNFPPNPCLAQIGPITGTLAIGTQ